MPLDNDKFTKHLREHALKKLGGDGKCAEYVRKALQAGGADIPRPYPAAGKLFGQTLLRLGYHQVSVTNPDTYSFLKGDVMVMQPHTGGRQFGHVAAFDGRNWISDFVQRDFWAGREYREQRPSYVVYRR